MSNVVLEQSVTYRRATISDIDALLLIEQRCFVTDRISKRSFRRWVNSSDDILLLVEKSQQIVGYGLVMCNQGTRLARLYSLAVLAETRGQGLAKALLVQLESAAAEVGRLFMRLEVAKPNTAAIQLYENNGYRVFGEYSDYYDDHSDALRMQKTIRHIKSEQTPRHTPWYQQTTEFTCGPASLMMAMASLDETIKVTQALELSLWREATTIFMTSGHGGCHPLGLAIAASKRGFDVVTYINSRQPLFIDGVRSVKKKAILETVHEEFVKEAELQQVDVVYSDVTQEQIQAWLEHNYAVIMLISTYRLDGKKAPHWVTATSIDDLCIYVHDPDLDDEQLPIDCQYLPIARDDFAKMSAFGVGRLRAAVAIRLRQ